MSLQAFKANDTTETKVLDAFLPSLEAIGEQLDAFYEGAWECYVLGDVLYAVDADPLAGVITEEVFRHSFFAIHNLFTRPGTFEFYLEVFRAVWGVEATFDFEIPSPGILNISIRALAIETNNFLMRSIVNNVYVYDTLVDEAGDKVLAQTALGAKSQIEAESLVHELCPAGIIATVTLDLSPAGDYVSFIDEDGSQWVTEDGDTLTGFVEPEV